MPSTPLRTTSHHSASHHQQVKANKIANHRPLPSRSNRNTELNGSRTTNTSANVSPSFNDNNSRTVLLGSDDIRTPIHKRHHQQSRQVHTDSTADYDEVASRSTVETPQTTSENTSVSEVPSESRFKTFVKQKKNKAQTNQKQTNHNGRMLTASEDTDNEPSTSLIEDQYDEPAPPPPVRTNASRQNETNGTSNQNSESTARNEYKLTNNQPKLNNSVHNGADDNNNDEDDSDSNEENDDDDVDEEDEQLDDEEDEEDDDEDEDAEEGVYDIRTGNSMRRNDSQNQSSSSQDSNGNLISIKHQRNNQNNQQRPLSDETCPNINNKS